MTPATYASICGGHRRAAAPTRSAPRGRTRPSAGTDPAERSPRRRSPTAARGRFAAGTPSATADPARGRSRGRTARRAWSTRRCAGWRRRRARSRPVAEMPVDVNRSPLICRQRLPAERRRYAPPRARRDCYDDDAVNARRADQMTSLLKTVPRPALRAIQLSRFGDRSDSDRQALRAAGRPRNRRLLRGGARVRPRRQRAAVDRAAARDHGRAPGRRTCGVRSGARRRVASRASSTAGSRGTDLVALIVDPAGRCSIASGSIEAFLRRGLRRPARPTSAPRSTASRRGRWRSICRRPTAGVPKRRPGVCYFFPAAVGRQRLQAAEPVPALDGPPRRARSRRLDARAGRRRSSCRSTRTSSAWAAAWG